MGKNNSGALFVNERKANEKQPDYTGKVIIEGTEYYISGWKKQSAGKKAFMSLAFTAVGASRVGGNDRSLHSDEPKDYDLPF